MKKLTAPVGIALALAVLSAAAAIAASTPPSSAPPAATSPSEAPPSPGAPPVAKALPAGSAPLLAAIFGEPAGADPTRPMPAQSGDCGLRMYRCDLCQDGRELCYTQICGNFVIEHCDACEPECILPPS